MQNCGVQFWPLLQAALKVEEGKRQIGLAIPIFGTQMVQLLLVLSSSVFVGRLGEFQVSACSLPVQSHMKSYSFTLLVCLQ